MEQTQAHSSSDVPRGRWWIGCLFAIVIIGRDCAGNTNAATGAPGGEKPTVSRMTLQLHDGALTAYVAATSIQQVLNEVSRLSGARIVWLGQREDRQVSVNFSALPLIDAVQRFLAPNNFLLIYASSAEGAKLTEIWVSPHKAVTDQPQVSLSPTPQLAMENEDEPSVDESVHSLEQILESYLETAARGETLDQRIESISALGGFVEHDPRIRPLLQQLASTESDPQVRSAASEALAAERE